MSEGQVYLATWKRASGKYLVSLVDYPHVFIEMKNFNDAVDEMYYLILREFGDGENLIEFDRPLPKVAIPPEFSQPELVNIQSNKRAFLNNKKEDLYDTFCPKCRRGLQRNDTPALLVDIDEGHDLVVSGLRNRVYSERFLRMLGEDFLCDVRLIDVVTVKRTRERYFEVEPKKLVHTVAARSRENYSGFYCQSCNWKVVRYPNAPDFMVSLKEVKSLTSKFFFLESAVNFLCCSGQRWRQILEENKLRGLKTDRLGVVPPDKIIQYPKLHEV